jgi:hypothetical protein
MTGQHHSLSTQHLPRKDPEPNVLRQTKNCSVLRQRHLPATHTQLSLHILTWKWRTKSSKFLTNACCWLAVNPGTGWDFAFILFRKMWESWSKDLTGSLMDSYITRLYHFEYFSILSSPWYVRIWELVFLYWPSNGRRFYGWITVTISIT